MKNQEIAQIFYEIADLLEMKKVQWKPQAYRRAAKFLETLSKDIEEIYKKGGIKALEDLPAIGEGLAKKIIQYIETGKINELEKLRKSIPEGVHKLMEIESIGPKKAMLLYKKLKIKNVKDLEQAIKKHKIKRLSNFGEKTEENIAQGIEMFKKGKERTLLGDMLPIAESIVNEIKKLKVVDKISLAGSLRRMNETIGDIDILVTSSNPRIVMDKFTTLPQISKVLAKGDTKSMIILKPNIQADIRVLAKDEFGSALQYFTGNKEHNIKTREIAIKKELKLSEYGLFKKSGQRIAGRTEEEIYKKLGLPYIEPELRENHGELEAAKRGKLPKLIDYNDVKGDLHIHTKYSDGDNTLEEMAKAAMALGYEYICITDHGSKILVANGLNEEKLLKQIEEIKKLNKKFKGFKILSGCEVDILSDGSLNFSDEILKKLDIANVAVHSGFKSSESVMTNRIIKALENPYVDILLHPTGRLLNKRPPYKLDMEQIFDVAQEKKKILEINCFKSRLDLKDIYIKSAIEHNIKLSLGTDSHNIDHLKFMRLGIAQARRGWAEKKDIVNTLNLKQLPKVFRKMKE